MISKVSHLEEFIMTISKNLFVYCFTILSLSTPLLIPNSAKASTVSSIEEARKEFSACEVNRNAPFRSTLLFKNKRFLEGNKRYTADIYQLYKNTKVKGIDGYIYNLRDSKKGGRIIANFKFDYRAIKKEPGKPQVFNSKFSACGPTPSDQSYPVVSYIFYDTTIGFKINGYRAPINIGQVTNTKPFRLVSVINQLDGPDFGQ